MSSWTPLFSHAIAQRWLARPNAAFLLPLPVVTLITGLGAWRAFGRPYERQPFAASISLFALSFPGIAVSLSPMIVPGQYTLWQAASLQRTQSFLLVNTLVLLPVILFYTDWSYWVFRGKVRDEFGCL